MTVPTAVLESRRRRVPATARDESPWVRRILIGIAFLFVSILLIIPLMEIFLTAFSRGVVTWWAAILEPDTISAIQLTLMAIAISVPVNTVFGIAAAIAISRYTFPCKRVLVSLIDIPFAVSPVIAGLMFILLFGAQSGLGQWLSEHGIRIIFAPPGIFLATLFVTMPFVVRELIPVLQQHGDQQELAALTLGASPLQTFFRVTLPGIRFGLLHGVTLCTARAAGEFGAVSVVSGHIRGETNTLPLHIEILYNEYRFTDAFAVSTLLVAVALLSLCGKQILYRSERKGVR